MNYDPRHGLGHGAVEVATLDRESDGMEAPGGGGHGHGGGSTEKERVINEMMAAFHEFEAAEEDKVPDSAEGHEADSGYGTDPATDGIDEVSDGASGASAAGVETRYEMAGKAALEADGYFPGAAEFGGEAFESVFGQDDRVLVGNTTPYPWRTICKLEITAADGARFGCSGALIGPRTVLTNGHCLYMHDHGGWVRSVRVIPGKNGASEPYGSATSTFYRSVTGWTQSQSSNYDYGVAVLPSNAKLGNTVGWMGLANLSFASLLGLNVNNSGYPGDKPYGTQWWNSNNVLMVTARRLFYRLDTYGGQSGSPVWRYKDGQRHIVAVHNTGGSVYNGSVRLSKPVFDNLVSWKNQYT